MSSRHRLSAPFLAMPCWYLGYLSVWVASNMGDCDLRHNLLASMPPCLPCVSVAWFFLPLPNYWLHERTNRRSLNGACCSRISLLCCCCWVMSHRYSSVSFAWETRPPMRPLIL